MHTNSHRARREFAFASSNTRKEDGSYPLVLMGAGGAWCHRAQCTLCVRVRRGSTASPDEGRLSSGSSNTPPSSPHFCAEGSGVVAAVGPGVTRVKVRLSKEGMRLEHRSTAVAAPLLLQPWPRVGQCAGCHPPLLSQHAPLHHPQHLQVGQAIATNGVHAFSEYCVAKEQMCTPLPEGQPPSPQAVAVTLSGLTAAGALEVRGTIACASLTRHQAKLQQQVHQGVFAFSFYPPSRRVTPAVLCLHFGFACALRVGHCAAHHPPPL